MGRKFGREMCGVLPFRSDKTGTLHPTMSAVPLPDATLAELNPKTWTVSVNRLFDTQSGILPG